MGFDITIRIAGEAGQGIHTIGLTLCRIIKRCGWNLFANQDYMSRVRGGNNYYQIRLSDTRQISFGRKVDILVALNGESVVLHRESLAANGRIIVDKSNSGIVDDDSMYVDVPVKTIAMESGGAAYYSGTVVLGSLVGLLSIDVGVVEQILLDLYNAKSEEIAAKNIACCRKGYEFGLKNRIGLPLAIVNAGEPRFLMDGNEAVALGAVYAGCRFYSGYPMTPATTIMETMARFSGRFPLVVEQAEDEIAAINMVIGASFAGVRSMTATSGGGFALMTEGISLAAMHETPVVIVNGQRPAPATGLPTRTEQADLDLVIHAGHGEFARVVYAPGTIGEAFELTVRAFDVADRFQIPAIILTDQYLADMVSIVNKPETDGLMRQRQSMSKDASAAVTEYRRYELTESGISPRAIPSWIHDVIYADSDEHTESGHITEEGSLRTAMVDKRFSKKMRLLRQEILPPVSVNIDKAQLVLLGFGSTCGVIEDFCRRNPDSKTGCIHFPQVWPFPADALKTLIAEVPQAQLITVENNAGGQLAQLIRRETRLEIAASILKYDGRPFTLDELSERIEELRRNSGSQTIRE